MRTWLCSRFGGLALAIVSGTITLIVNAVPGSPAHAAVEGFGAATVGGRGGAVVHVTNLNSRGPGSLREALSGGHRIVVFNVGGSIVLDDHIYVRGAFVTIDGSTAPSPGITLVGRGLVIRGDLGAHHVIVRHLRIRDSTLDNLQVAGAASNILIEHVSVAGAGDGNLDITEGSHDVTVAWSIIAEPVSHKSMLIKYNAYRITLHHNLFAKSSSRNPSASVDDAGTPSTRTTVDIRNNVVWGWGAGYGTLVHHGANANIVGNYYASPLSAVFDRSEALRVCSGSPTCLGGELAAFGRAYVNGNIDGDGLTAAINRESTESGPFHFATVTTTDACTALGQVLDGAGARPLDARDAGYVAAVTRTGCADARATTTALTSSLDPSTDGNKVTFRVTVKAVDPTTAKPTGSITISDNGLVIQTLALASGAASFSSSRLKPGEHALAAVYAGDTRFAGSTSPTLVQTVRGSPKLPLRNWSRIAVSAALAPCCDAVNTPGAEGLITRKEAEENNAVLSDVLRGAVTLPIPLAGIVDRATARTADVRLALSRNATRYAECSLAFSSLGTLEPSGQRVAIYKLVVALAPGAGGGLALTESQGRCDVDPAIPGIQPGIPNVVYGDDATLTIGPDDTRVSVLESSFVMQ